MHRHIVQMMPSNGWYARYRDEDPPYYRLSRLIAWTLVEIDGDPEHRWICGFEVGGGDGPDFTADDTNHFLGYVYVDEITNADARQAWTEEGKQWLRPADLPGQR